MNVGDIVTVVLDCTLQDCQGLVSAIMPDGDEDGPIEVTFFKEAKHYFFGDSEQKVRFQETDLRVVTEWSGSIMAERLFPRMYHSVFELPYPFRQGLACMYEGCEIVATRRTYYNYIGSVCPIDACDVHAREWEGLCTESGFPMKRSYPDYRVASE